MPRRKRWEHESVMYRMGPCYRVGLVRDGGSAEPVVADTPEKAVAVFRANLEDSGVEQFAVAALNIRHRVIAFYVVSVGCLSNTLVHPREVFAPALVCKAAAIVVGHNHPSGNAEPSAEDLALTRRLVSAGLCLGVEVMDHVILGDGWDGTAPDGWRKNGWVSLKQRGVI